jgi:hypothetical protein
LPLADIAVLNIIETMHHDFIRKKRIEVRSDIMDKPSAWCFAGQGLSPRSARMELANAIRQAHGFRVSVDKGERQSTDLRIGILRRPFAPCGEESVPTTLSPLRIASCLPAWSSMSTTSACTSTARASASLSPASCSASIRVVFGFRTSSQGGLFTAQSRTTSVPPDASTLPARWLESKLAGKAV